MQRADYFRVRPEETHLSLIAMTVLIQLSVGALLFLPTINPNRQLNVLVGVRDMKVMIREFSFFVA